ncbi:hypothetical protein PG984_014655 [Apiospora sp. TS-2023a]
MPSTKHRGPDHSDQTNLCASCSIKVPLQDDNEYGTGQKGLISWDDTCPEYPSLDASSEAGCAMCSMLRKALLRRNIAHQGAVRVVARYKYEFQDEGYDLDGGHGGPMARFPCRVTDHEDRELATIMFSMTSGDDRICEWLGTSGYYETYPLHRKNVKRLKKVLKSWALNARQSPDGFLPTRLINVGRNGGPKPRLVITADYLTENPGTDIDYACLSYCWGPKDAAGRQLTTTSNNLDSHCQYIDIDQLPPVVGDTVLACRTLGIQFVWIDALCIVQGDSDDWDRESAMMASVYFYSHLTICPLTSRSCLEGFLGPREMGVQLPFHSLKHPGLNGHYRLSEAYNDTDADDIMPQEFDNKVRTRNSPFSLELDKLLSTWAKRGWTMQEEQCSRRILYFGRKRLHYVCRESSIIRSEDSYEKTGKHRFWIRDNNTCYKIMCMLRSIAKVEGGAVEEEIEERTHGEASGDDRSEWETTDSGESSGDESERETNPVKVMEAWHASTMDACYRSLTNPQDLFPSIAGFAESCAGILGDTYLAGIWKSDLHFGLLWKMEDHPFGTLKSTLASNAPPQDLFIAPSWSWASQERPFNYCASAKAEFEDWPRSRAHLLEKPSVDSRNEVQYWSMLEAMRIGFDRLRSMIKLIDYHMETRSGGLFGSLRGGEITLLAKVLPLQNGDLFPWQNVDLLHEGSAMWKASAESPWYLGGGKGHLYLDWSVGEQGLGCTDELRLVLTAVGCPGTSKVYKEMWGYGPPLPDAESLIETWAKASRNTPPCHYCLEDIHYGHHYGIVIHRSSVASDRYYRVGAFAFYGGSNGGRIFDNVPPREITLI